MPPKVSRLLFLTVTLIFSVNVFAQQQENDSTAPNNVASPDATVITAPLNLTPTLPSSIQDRLLKVRGMIAARQLPAAASELEKIKKETGDDVLQSVVRTMLISVYLEQPNYDRAKDLLEDTYKRNKNRKDNAENFYLPVAAQFIKGAENQLERYKRLGFNLSDPKLPTEAVTDLERWRKMLETVVEQAKKMSEDEKKSAESLAVLEEAANARASLARDNYEAAAWRNTIDDTREMIANAQTKVTEVDGTAVDLKNVAELKLPNPTETSTIVSSSNQAIVAAPTKTTGASEIKTADEAKPEAAADAFAPNTVRTRTTNDKSLLSRNVYIDKTDFKVADGNGELVKMDSIVDLATSKFPPTYPPTARTARVAGVVKVEVVVDENGSVAEIKNSEGPELLRRAAADAIKRWKFKPATREGQRVRMSGFVNFNFTL